MFSRIFTPSTGRSVLGQVSKTYTRSMATVQSNTPRLVPAPARRSTPISHERATFTIKVRHDSPALTIEHRLMTSERTHLPGYFIRCQGEHLW